MAQTERDLYEQILEWRDADRGRKKRAVYLVRGKELAQQKSRQGLLRWYLHPSLDHNVIKSLLVYEQEIPPGSRTGRQQFQGGMWMYILEGEGYTLIDGVRYDWKKGDVVCLPNRPGGIVHQSFNSSADDRARFLAGAPNLLEALGPDLGAGLEQLEEAPEYGS